MRLYLINRWLLPWTGLAGLGAQRLDYWKGLNTAYHGIGRGGALKVQIGAIGDLMRHFSAVLNARGGERKRRQARQGAQAWGVLAVAEDG
jgi:hypothetical protein